MKSEKILKESEVLMILPEEKKAHVFSLRGQLQRNLKGTTGKKYRGILTLTKKELVFKGHKLTILSQMLNKKDENFHFPLNKIRSVNIFKVGGFTRLEIVFQDKDGNTKSNYFAVLETGFFGLGLGISNIETDPLLKEWSEVINKAREKF